MNAWDRERPWRVFENLAKMRFHANDDAASGRLSLLRMLVA